MTAASDLTHSRLSTPKGIKYALTAGPTFAREAHGKTTAEATYRIYGRQLLDFIDEMLPVPFVRDSKIIQPQLARLRNSLSQSGSDGYLAATSIKSVALAEPDGNAILDPFKIDSDANGLTNGFPTYGRYANVTIQYESNIDAAWTGDRTNADDPIRFLDMQVGATFEFLSVHSNSNFLTAPATTPVSNGAAAKPTTSLTSPVVRLNPLIEHTGRWAWAVNPDFSKIWNLLGAVNTGLLSYIRGAPPETVMFMGLSGRQEYRHAGNLRTLRTWALEYKFLQRMIFDDAGGPYGWNHFYNSATQQFERAYRQNPQTKSRFPLYKLSTFTDLYQTAN